MNDYRRRIEEQRLRRDVRGWIEHMLKTEPPRELVALQRASAPVVDAEFWSQILASTDEQVQERVHAELDVLPVEVERLGLDWETCLVRYRVIALPVDTREAA